MIYTSETSEGIPIEIEVSEETAEACFVCSTWLFPNSFWKKVYHPVGRPHGTV